MVDLANIQKIYLVGIGGIGMSGLARFFHQKGYQVAGYDKTATPLTKALETEGILVTYTDEISAIADEFIINQPETLVIFTPAIPKDSKILNHFSASGFQMYKRSQVLGLLSANAFTVAVAGTHGKTTTSTLVAHLLQVGGLDCSAFLGGISTNYNTNLLTGASNVMVVEADEYDRSFLTLHPNIAVVTSMDADHLDIYGEASHLQESFRLFTQQIKPEGKLIFKESLPLQDGTTYGISSSAQAKASNIRVENHKFYFDFDNDFTSLKNLELGLPGAHNVENAVAAIQVALSLDIDAERIREGLASFKGVKRRFEYQVQTDRHIYIDDYAHHPEELKACFKAARTLYPDKKLTVLFQPHLFSRTRDFMDEFAHVLSTADDLLLMEIYPARELPIKGVTSGALAAKVDGVETVVCNHESALELLKNKMPQLLLTVGAGDIDTLVLPLKKLLENA
ncbi:UDP-N-acetylmuramate--L-alanine ligase [Pelobium manganitolerans]|uniref:UDP-N-acetylmuramate--L-alanine ligase n=1 Tax=Pelobium manganitolerans TaxID=1842495 RepID=A0A419S2M6_9SPHI|nr:UDP-N-acetylmuramate--L-alanine ligase [Pelobium manganitolerans]RKD13238.1 UDP-N-acetylmuramate--L-alanine ligase [Pelobium manganitolerans]